MHVPHTQCGGHLEEVYLLDAVLSGLGVHHVKYLDLLEGHNLTCDCVASSVHTAELTLTNLLLNLKTTKCKTLIIIVHVWSEIVILNRRSMSLLTERRFAIDV